MECCPIVSWSDEKVAVPATTGDVTRIVEPSINTTEPVGLPAAAETVAVSSNVCLTPICVSVLLKRLVAGVEPGLFTSWIKLDELAAPKDWSPE